MKILCDVHISYKVCNFFNDYNHRVVHVNQILNKSETKDSEICEYADKHDFIVLTKDLDFKNSFLLKLTPKKLIKINLGNISNIELIKILEENLDLISNLYKINNFLLEIDKDRVNYIEI
jgi:predicted nuclease of predicted toxin-antitoxin system